MNFIERHRLFEKVDKVRSIIRSCVTDLQLKSADNMANNLIRQLPECDEKYIAKCFFIAESGKKLIQIIEKELATGLRPPRTDARHLV